MKMCLCKKIDKYDVCPKTAGNFVEDVLDKSSLSEIYGPVDIECSLTSGSPSVNVKKKVKSTGQRTR